MLMNFASTSRPARFIASTISTASAKGQSASSVPWMTTTLLAAPSCFIAARCAGCPTNRNSCSSGVRKFRLRGSRLQRAFSALPPGRLNAMSSESFFMPHMSTTQANVRGASLFAIKVTLPPPEPPQQKSRSSAKGLPSIVSCSRTHHSARKASSA